MHPQAASVSLGAPLRPVASAWGLYLLPDASSQRGRLFTVLDSSHRHPCHGGDAAPYLLCTRARARASPSRQKQ